jgi:tetratricopeptide (TPR) repeat protein
MAELSETVEQGAAALKNGNAAEAVTLLEEASRQEPDGYEVFVYLGAAYSAENRLNAAIGAFKRAAEIRPDSAQIHYNLGQAYEAAGVPKEAWLEYEASLERDPSYAKANAAISSLSTRLPDLMAPSIQMESDTTT